MSAFPATIGLTPTTGTPVRRRSSRRSRIPGTARIGPIETIGFEGARTTSSAVRIAASTSGVGRAAEGDGADGWLLTKPDEVLLELESTGIGVDDGPDGLVAHRQDSRRHSKAALEVKGDLRRSAARQELLGPHQVGRDVPVPEPKPRRLAEALELGHDRPRLVPETPAPLPVVEAGEGIEDGVVVGPDGEAVALEVVAGVDDDG